MNNRLTLTVFVCASLALGVLLYAVFFSNQPVAQTSGTAIGLLLTSLGLYVVSAFMYRKKRSGL